MFNQIIMGKPKKCPIPTCKEKWFKDSFRGHAPHTEQTVYCIMKCPKCHYQFMIIQGYSIIKEYLNELPIRPQRNLPNISLITDTEVKETKQLMESTNILQSLGEFDSM